MKKRSLGIPTPLWLLILILSGCAPAVSVTTDYDRSADLTKYSTYAFYEETPTGQRENSNLDASLDTKLRSAIRSAMIDRGLTHTTSDPDLKVAYDVSVDTELYVNTNYTYPTGFGYGYGYWYGYRYNYGTTRFPATYKTVEQYKEGTVILDIVDADSNELVWRGVGEAAVDVVGDIDQDRINTILKEILQEFPRSDK